VLSELKDVLEGLEEEPPLDPAVKILQVLLRGFLEDCLLIDALVPQKF